MAKHANTAGGGGEAQSRKKAGFGKGVSGVQRVKTGE